MVLNGFLRHWLSCVVLWALLISFAYVLGIYCVIVSGYIAPLGHLQEITLAANDKRQFSLYFSFTVHRIFQKFKYYNACQVIPESLFFDSFYLLIS